MRVESQEDPNCVDLCSYTSRQNCRENSLLGCTKVHFTPHIQRHTDISLGDCSYLNTCHRMETCRYLHWVVEDPIVIPKSDTIIPSEKLKAAKPLSNSKNLLPPQWVNCDLRVLDVSVLGKFDVVMMDPPWDIHMSLPYGTMTDDEMLKMPIPQLQNDGGLLFVWVTGRALELGRDCMRTWGFVTFFFRYERVEEIVWVKTNQLQRLIRTGRTGHYLNHSKEHCLVGFKRPANLTEGSMTTEEIQKALSWVKRGIDVDVIVAEVRETSRKPDEIYEMIERACPGGRKLELFGRPYNFRPGW
ncbi:m6a methyltransferase [Phakopsora pachyrhizi]|uniref:mRNA m(6)A methyltransferase n=1 Tax=Phakopsora pachyrhizi TaxID=170000 RepID=A0AAV0BBG5_PHAPC|nr:m6a methyltransferase [Phakopsora pachyrhizi]